MILLIYPIYSLLIVKFISILYPYKTNIASRCILSLIFSPGVFLFDIKNAGRVVY